MINTKICDWLMDNADAPIRYRVAREFLKYEKTAKNIKAELLFFAQYISKYPAAIKTKWYGDLLHYIEKIPNRNRNLFIPCEMVKGIDRICSTRAPYVVR